MIAKGTFSVSMTPAESRIRFNEPAQFGQLALNKTFNGELEATSVGQMMSIRLADSASAGYVALEQVTGTLAGYKGSFVLQHFGVMTAISQRLILEVVPDSGTDELAGLSGEMTIDIKDGQHFYELTYEML
ncbi:MAG: DUF3224 domain-containing protein [Reinekea sp.]|nr:DUF3224 domain-containing protein [Reinekea sp.]